MEDVVRSVSDSEAIQHLKNLSVFGYTRVESFLDRTLVERLKLLVESYWDPARTYLYSNGEPAKDKNVIYNLQNKDKSFIDLLDGPFVTRVLMESLNDPYYYFLPPDVPNYVLSNYNARSSVERLDLHIDSYIPVVGKRALSVQVTYMLDDQTEDNGCTVVAPGSHLSGEFADREMSTVEPVISRAGDLVMWDTRLWHGTRANSVQQSRWALLARVTRWWMKPAVDIPRSLPDEIYRQLSPRQKALLGFCAIPPIDETLRINTKAGYEVLRTSVADYSG